MFRRHYVAAALGVLGLAGCAETEDGDQGDSPTDQPSPTPTNTVTETPTESATETETQTETETETPTETETETPAGSPDVAVAQSELVVDDSGAFRTVYVAATLTNEGDGDTGQITLQVDWYDADGNFLDNSTAYLQHLAAGETWLARVTALGNEDQIEDFELTTEVEEEPPQQPTGAELLDSEMQIGEDTVTITGHVENQREETMGYLEAIGKLYDAEDNVLSSEWTNQADVPPGTTWEFTIEWIVVDRIDAVASHQVVLDATL